MAKAEALATLLLIGAAFIGASLLLQQFSVSDWSSFASIGGILLFSFFAILIGAVTRSLSAALIGSAALTALVMVFVLVPFAIVMGAVFVVSLGLKIWDAGSGGSL